MRGLLFFVLFASVLPKGVSAQMDFKPGDFMAMLGGELYSDRPGQAITPFSAGILAFQIQSGLKSENYTAPDNSWDHIASKTTIRLGLSQRLEFNTSFEYRNTKWYGISGDPVVFSGFGSPEIGLRMVFVKGKKWVPTVALQSNLSFKSSKGDFQQMKTGSSFYLATNHTFRALGITTNLGMKFFGNGLSSPDYSYVLNFNYLFGSKWSCFLEGFGSISNETLNGDAGIAFRPKKYLQFDLYGGWLGGLDFDVPHWFIEAGVTWKLSVISILAKKKMESMMNNNWNE